MAASLQKSVVANIETNSAKMNPSETNSTKECSSRELLDVGKQSNSPFLIRNKEKNGPPKIFKMPQSSVLSRVQGFLPQMAAADADLRQRIEAHNNPEIFDIENVQDCEGPIIEMNLALVEGGEDSGDESEEELSSSEDQDITDRKQCHCDSNGDTEHKGHCTDNNNDRDERMPALFSKVTEHNIKLHKEQKTTNQKAKIEVMDSVDSEEILK